VDPAAVAPAEAGLIVEPEPHCSPLELAFSTEANGATTVQYRYPENPGGKGLPPAFYPEQARQNDTLVWGGDLNADGERDVIVAEEGSAGSALAFSHMAYVGCGDSRFSPIQGLSYAHEIRVGQEDGSGWKAVEAIEHRRDDPDSFVDGRVKVEFYRHDYRYEPKLGMYRQVSESRIDEPEPHERIPAAPDAGLVGRETSDDRSQGSPG